MHAKTKNSHIHNSKTHHRTYIHVCVYEFNYNTFNYPLDEVLGKNEYISKHLKKKANILYKVRN